MSAEGKDLMSWEDVEAVEPQDEDFLADAKAQEVPKACSIDNPQCESCQ